MIVLAGRLLDVEKYVGCEFEETNEASGLPVLEAAHEVVALKVRRASAAAVREEGIGREERSKPEAVEAMRRVRDAMVSCAWR